MLLLTMALAGCAVGKQNIINESPAGVPARHSVAEFSADERIFGISDPWEKFNLRMYRFNYDFDKYFFLPVVEGYEFITPVFVQNGVSNFFDNVGEFHTLYNNIFQLKGKKSLITLGRLVANTTIGIGGLFDPATSMGLKKQTGDFGQTLGYWGVDSGPYLVMPILGPNTLRSTGGSAVDAGIRYIVLNSIFNNVDNGTVILFGASALEAVDLRYRQKFRYYDSGYPFEYYIVRAIYLKSEELSVSK